MPNLTEVAYIVIMIVEDEGTRRDKEQGLYNQIFIVFCAKT